MKIIQHTRIKDLADVTKWLNENGVSLNEVQITYTYNPRGSHYVIFYETEVEDKK